MRKLGPPKTNLANYFAKLIQTHNSSIQVQVSEAERIGGNIENLQFTSLMIHFAGLWKLGNMENLQFTFLMIYFAKLCMTWSLSVSIRLRCTSPPIYGSGLQTLELCMSLCLCLSLCLSASVICEDGGPLDKYKILIFGGNAHIKIYVFIFGRSLPILRLSATFPKSV